MHHLFSFSDDFGLACHTCEVMPRIRISAFHSMRACLATEMPFWRQHVGTGFPVSGIKYPGGQMLDFIRQALEGCSITTTESPGHGSPWAMIHGFDQPEFAFFECRKCHSSAKSSACTSCAIVGSA